MKAEIITIGDEILIGQIVDTNSAWMAEELNKIGVSVAQITSISDTPVHLVNALDDAGLRADVILITGGLGPTKDDRTKKVLAEYFNSTLVMHHPTLDHISSFFKRRGLGVNQLNSDQALVPECCEVLSNPVGTAPGMWFDHNEKIFVSMPGVPFEMKEIMQASVLPRLKSKNGNGFIVHKTVHTIGIPESILAEKLEDWENALPEFIHLAYLPNPGQIRLRFSAFGIDETYLKKAIEAEIVKLKEIIPDAIFGYGNDTLAGVVGKLLIDKKATVAAAESCTGGQIAHSITSVPGCSGWFKGSVVAYANDMKSGVLKVSADDIEKHGAVSETVVMQMAEGVRKLTNADYSLATSGIAGPDGGTADKPVGTVWIAVATPDKTFAQKYTFSNNRERNIIRSAQTALNMLREVLEKGIFKKN
ncbi:MAG: competence/damage-inducible protein A [Prolixibacteraceae bacterium]|jgi:nicotinamide-nucleotide amidase|nr:competence/damage-inducible protein A [Prolixibacteraceae bacterium]